MYKWKIAYLYQKQEDISITPVFTKAALELYAKKIGKYKEDMTMSELYLTIKEHENYKTLEDAIYTAEIIWDEFLNFDFDTATKDRFGWNKNTIESACVDSDLILPHKEKILDPNDWKTPATLETHYKHSHYPEDYDQVIAFIEKEFPLYGTAAKQASCSYNGYFCNMFIMTREKFFDYAQWLFGIILPMADELSISNQKYQGAQKRVLGFLGERLFNIWITKQAADNIKIKELQRLTGYLTSQDQQTFIKTYGDAAYTLALSASKRYVASQTAFDKSVNADGVIFHPARISYIPKVSILVPVYNVSEFLVECIESLIHQTIQETEIIFVNNASTDNSLDILKDYYKKDPRIVVIEHKENEGLPGSRNTALRYVRGKYFGFVDSDDICDLQMFEKMYQKAECLGADIVTCCVMGFYDTLEHQYWHRPLEWYGNSDRLLPLSGRPQQLMEPAAWCKLFRTTYIKNLDYFAAHPKSHIKFDGFQIPNWEKIKKLVLEASLVNKNIHVVGWDVAVTKEGATFIEGNRRPGFDLVQVLSKKGRKDIMRHCLNIINEEEHTNYKI